MALNIGVDMGLTGLLIELKRQSKLTGKNFNVMVARVIPSIKMKQDITIY